MTIQPKTKIGRYQILELIGRGGMAEVYKARDSRLDTTVAIKFIRTNRFPPDILDLVVKRFRNEAKRTAQLSHPNIVNVSDYGIYEDIPFLVMDYMPGGTYKQYLGKLIPYQEAAGLLIPIARALAFAHKKGIVHRDVKPSNILIGPSGDPMLADFGVAKIVNRDNTQGLTATGASIGTPAYMAPEQAMGEKIDSKVDIYSLGVVFYELVTGRRPFTADTPMKVVLKQANQPPPNPSQFVKGLPAEVEQAIEKALAKDPAARYQTMDEFEKALKELTSGARPAGASRRKPASPARAAKRSAKPETPQIEAQTSGTPLWQRWYTWAGAGLLTAAIVVAGFLIFGGDGESGAEAAQTVDAPAVQGEMADTPQPTATFVPTPTRDYRKNPDPITPENIERLALNTSIPYPDEVKGQYWSRIGKAPVSNELIGSIRDRSNQEYTYYRIEIDPDAEFEILDDLDEEYSNTYATFSAYQKVVAENVSGSVDVRTYPGDELLMSTATLFSTITSIALSPDGHYLAVGQSDGRVMMWNVQKDEYLDLEMHHYYSTMFWSEIRKGIRTLFNPVAALAFSPDGRYLVSGGSDADINIWEVPTGKKVDSISKHVEDIEELMFSQDGQYLISAGDDARIFIWDFQSFELVSQCEVFSISGKEWGFFSAQFNQNHTENILLFMGYGNLADLIGNKNEKFILVEIPTCRVLYDFDAAEYEKAFFSDDDRFLVNINEDGIDLYSVKED